MATLIVSGTAGCVGAQQAPGGTLAEPGQNPWPAWVAAHRATGGATGVLAEQEPWPLWRAAMQLGGRYAVAVTYEDPVLLRPDDMVLLGNRPDSALSYMARPRHVEMPGDLTPTVTPKLDSAALGKLFDAYHRANADGPHFKILETSYGLHIVPDTVRDQSGQFVRATTLLDAKVTIPVAERMAGEHLDALYGAIARASNVNLTKFWPSFDQYYAANGLSPSMSTLLRIGQLGDAAKRPYSFTWGASDVTAREALLSLLNNSATTMAWYVTCHPNPTPGLGSCMFSVVPLKVSVTGPDGSPDEKDLSFDRCVKCPALPPRTAPPQR